MADEWIKYHGTGFPVPLGSEIELKLHLWEEKAQVVLGTLVCYESYTVKDYPTEYPSGFYWKVYVGNEYFNFNCSQIDCYRIIKSSMPELTFNELSVCKDLIWTLFHGSSKDFKFRGVSYLRREHDLRNSEICNLLGLKSEDIDFILNNPDDIQ